MNKFTKGFEKSAASNSHIRVRKSHGGLGGLALIGYAGLNKYQKGKMAKRIKELEAKLEKKELDK